MRFRLGLLMVVSVLLGGIGAEAALNGHKVKVEIEPPVERKWRHWGNKMGVDYYGTYDHGGRHGG